MTSEEACTDVDMYETQEIGRTYVCASGHEINNVGEKKIQLFTDEGTQAAIKFQTCTSIAKVIASVAKIVDNGHRVV